MTSKPIIHDRLTASSAPGAGSNRRRYHIPTWPSTLVVGYVIAIAVPIAGCGSTHGSTGGSTNGPAAVSKPSASFVASAREYAQCMRSHGEPSFPDPTVAGTFTLNGSNINPQSPAYQTARQRCSKQRAAMAGSSPYKRTATENQKLRDLKFAKCMRSHGVTDYPDPTYVATPDGGSELAPLPSSINQQSPGFISAQKACQAG
jgi:hypothetical protein